MLQEDPVFNQWRRFKGMEWWYRPTEPRWIEILLWWAGLYVCWTHPDWSKNCILWYLWQSFA